MDEDAGIRAPVTRLRRRISIEQSEESKSPAVNTPTTRRGGRRKPELELIDENTPDNGTTKKTVKKAPIKDLIDSVEEKPVTPSRRSTRIKSNTSIVSETVAVDSPRAKRAIRRLSQVGSDSEAPLTPVRQTRRTRKDSTSSIEKVEPAPSKPVLHINDVIVEEPENVSRKSSSGTNDTNTSPTNIRKSPRLQGKANKNDADNEKENVEQTKPQKQSEQNSIQESKDDLSTEVKDSQKSRLSQTTSDLIKNLKTAAKVEKTNLNKSTSALESQLEGKQKRKRTKSWTTLTVSNESNFYSDNEDVKKKLREKNKGKLSLDKINELNSGDGLNKSLKQNEADQSISKKKKKNSNSFVVEDINTSLTDSKNKTVNEENNENSSVSDNSQKSNTSDTIKLFEKDPSANIHTTVFIEDDSDTNSAKVRIQNRYEHEDQCVPEVKHTNQLEKDSSKISVSSEKILDIVNKSKDSAKLNDSCEPMDIDETIPENLLTSQVNSSSPVVLLEKSVSNESNSSGRKSSLSQNMNKSGNENKSTLILSQLKDNSTDINNVTKSPQNKDLSLKATDDLNTSQENDASKRNLSLNYVNTSTPLQQKKLAKLGNFNTPIIACNDGGKDEETNELSQSKYESKISNRVENDSSKNKLDLNNSISNKIKSNNISHNSSNKNVHNSSKDSSEDTEEDLHNKENEILKDKNNSLNKTRNQSSSVNDSDSDNESASDEESHNTSNVLDDEAEDAGDDYESGDSLDENERQYQKENEILEKGETLSSENEFSDDSDYEKDSFVVSTDAEDNELLEGIEDDLSMSDNELTMSAKSKEKYNERKRKEQKNASREMFESRHKLNRSKSKKQIQSSSESEDETETKTKKHNKMRLDSSQEVSLLEDKVSKKKAKRLSESICDDNAINEIEITACNESLKETDPLSTSVKGEPKTPQKSNASIAFINTDNDQNDRSELTQTQTEFQDPLDDSMAEEDSLSSDSENIIQNYDSVLEGLNKTSKTKPKECDMSLNVDKKQKKKKNTTIVDELNLTQAKPAKKLNNKNNQKETIVESTKTKLDVDDGTSSDSINLQLLFSEDSNSSDNIQNKQNIFNSNKEQFIPLKKVEGKTNLRESIETMVNMSTTSLNKSSSKKNNKDKCINVSDDDTDENGAGFFIDTEGSFNKSANKSISKTKKMKISLETHDATESDSNEVAAENDKSLHIEETVVVENSDSDAPMDIPFRKEKRLSKSFVNTAEDIENETVVVENSDSDAPMDVPFRKEKRLSKSFDNTAEDIENETDTTTQASNKSLLKTPGSSKKKKRESQSEPEQGDIIIQGSEKTLLKTPGSSKKSKRVSQSEQEEQEDPTLPISDVSLLKTPASSEKKTRVSKSEQELEVTTTQTSDILLKTPGSSKKKKRVTQSEQEQEDTLPINDKSLLKSPGSSKKNKHLSHSEQEQEDATIQASNISLLKTPGSSKKRKRVSQSEQEQDEIIGESLNLSVLKTPASQKKKKSGSQETESKEIEDTSESSLERSKVKSPGSHKKSKVVETQELKPINNEEDNTSTGNDKKSKKYNSIMEAYLSLTSAVHSENDDTKAKKRKRKSSTTNNTQEETIEDVYDTHKKSNDLLVVRQTKKRKISQNDEIISNAEPTAKDNQLLSQNINKEKKIKNECEAVTNNTELPKERRNNKRKQRDEDEGNGVCVPRLPASILKQLDDKPKEISIPKKPKVVSTTEFTVVEAKIRKNKPSNYLEESVYLNDNEVLHQKRKKRLPKPRVLPFVPTASTSASGYTTNFKVNVIPNEIKFLAQSDTISNFKDEYLYNKKIKRQGTYELYKRKRNIKLSKF